MHDRLITRRSVLVGAVAVVALGGLSGCTDDIVDPTADTVPPPPSRDVSTADLLASNKRSLIQRYATVTARHPQLAPDLAGFVRRHNEHLDALTVATPAMTAATPAGPRQRSESAPDEAAAVAELASAEAAAGRGRVLLVTPVESSWLATLVASIGACESAQAILLGATVTPTRQVMWPEGELSTTEVGMLQTALAAEHAAIYGYGVAGAHLAGYDREAAAVAHDDHRNYRDQLSEVIRNAGAVPGAAAPAYALPFDVVSAHAARRLASYVEEGISRAYAGVVRTAGTGGLRLLGARTLTTATVRRTQWGGPLTAFPGLTDPLG